MERRGGRGGRPWRSREAARGPRDLLPSSSSSSSASGDRWRPSPSQPSASMHTSKSQGAPKLVSDENRTAEGAEPVVDKATTPLIGACPDMCPGKERVQREQLRDLAVFERLDGNPGRTSPSLAVKKVKFHIISDRRLRRCCGKLNISSMLHLNKEQLIKSLVSLYDLYTINRRSDNRNYNEAEFYSFYVLLQLGYNSKEGGLISLWFQTMEFSILQSKEMHFVRSVLRYFRMGNYRHFFKIIAAESSYLQFCLLEPVINEVRAQALSYIIYSGYKLHPYPLAHLSHVLMMKESDLKSLCHACGLETSTDEAGHLLLPTKQAGFHMPKAFENFSLLDSESLKRWEADGGIKPGFQVF